MGCLLITIIGVAYQDFLFFFESPPRRYLPLNLKLGLPLVLFSGHYRALGRTIHLQYLKERLLMLKNVEFNVSSTRINSNESLLQELEILADTLYIEVIYKLNVVKTKCK